MACLLWNSTSSGTMIFFLVLVFCIAAGFSEAADSCPVNKQLGPCSRQLTCAMGATCLMPDNVCCYASDIVGGDGCFDDPVANCATRKTQGLCTKAEYIDQMTKQCPQTCGLCGAGKVCQDTDNRCTMLPNVCNNAQMRVNCRRTCGIC